MTEHDTRLWKHFCSHFVPSKEELKARAELCNQLWPEESHLSLWTSDLLLQDTFWFQLPWDMEQTAEPVRFENGIDWAYFPGEDEEFTFMMNRHRYWICLGQAYNATGDEKYAQCFVRQFLDWFEKEPLRESAYVHTWRTIEAGLRVDYWCRAMALFAHSPAVTDTVIEKFFESLEDHGLRLSTNPRIGFSLKSNWGILEYTGLYLLGFVLNKQLYLDQARYFLKAGLHIQVLDDGMQWETSPMYHNEVLMCMMEAVRISRIFKDDLFDQEELNLIRKMAEVDLYLQNPVHRQPMIGDSDDTDLRDLITQAAYLFSDGSLKFGGYEHLDYESIWLYGTEGYHTYNSLLGVPVPAGLKELDCSCQAVLRAGWGKNDFWLYFVNGPQGGGHGHSDKLHVSLWMDGDEILADPGRLTYTDTQPRYDLKNAVSHNVPMVDGEEYSPAVESWSCAALPVSTPNRIYQKKQYTLMEGGHTGYAHKGVFVSRRVVSIGDEIVVICDDFIGGNPQKVSQRFHFGEQIALESNGQGIAGRGNHCAFHVQSFADGERILPAIGEGLFSRHYNQQSCAPVMQTEAAGAQALTTFIVRDTARKVQIKSVPLTNFSYGRTLDKKEGEGYIIQTGDSRFGLVLLHQDVGNTGDLNGLEKVYGLGRTMVCDLNQNPQYMTVLQW